MFGFAESAANTRTAARATGQGPSREQVSLAMRNVSGAVMVCAMATPNVPTRASVRLTFAASGRVTSASVPRPFAGTAVGACISRAVRRAVVPPFTLPSFSVSYPFRTR